MVMVGGGIVIFARKVHAKFFDHAHFGYKLRPSHINNSVRSEFLGCSNEETNSKSIRTGFVATCS